MRMLHVLRKPLSEGTVAANTLKHGTGGLNIDASRVGASDVLVRPQIPRTDNTVLGKGLGSGTQTEPSGRWPANVILQHLDGCRCDGVKRVKGSELNHRCSSESVGGIYSPMGTVHKRGHTDEDGKETVANWICEPGCPVARLDGQTEPTKSKRSMRGVGWSDSEVFGSGDPAFDTSRGFDDAGGVSRFFKQIGGKADG